MLTHLLILDPEQAQPVAWRPPASFLGVTEVSGSLSPSLAVGVYLGISRDNLTHSWVFGPAPVAVR